MIKLNLIEDTSTTSQQVPVPTASQAGFPHPTSGCKRWRDWNPGPFIEKVHNRNNRAEGRHIAEACLPVYRGWFDHQCSRRGRLESPRRYFTLGGMGALGPFGRMLRSCPGTPVLRPCQDRSGVCAAVRRDSFRTGQGLVMECLRHSRNDSFCGKSRQRPLSPVVRGADAGLPVSVYLSHRHPTHCRAYQSSPRSCISFMTASSLARASTSMVAVMSRQQLGKSLMST